MKRHAYLKRTPLPRVNRKRRAALFASAYESTDRVEWTKRLPCAICGARPSECAHVTHSKAAGGDANCTGPLCERHHTSGADSLHTLGIDTFQKHHGCDLTALAARYAARWDAEGFTEEAA
jgi:hypothetical protein